MTMTLTMTLPSAVRLDPAALGQHELEQLSVACARGPGGAEQVELPHLIEPAVVAVRDFGIRAIEGRPPRHQRRIIVCREVVHILGDEQPFDRGAEDVHNLAADYD